MRFQKGLILTVLSLPATYAFSQQINFRHASIDDGLSQNAVYSILQDSRSFMWFGTKDELNRYNGLNFVICQNEHDTLDAVRTLDSEYFAQGISAIWYHQYKKQRT